MILSIDLKDRIKSKLESTPAFRDNDFALCVSIWRDDLKDHCLLFPDFNDFTYLFSQGQLSHSESIRRYRQMLQEEFPHLRGEKYYKRHKHAEIVKENLLIT